MGRVVDPKAKTAEMEIVAGVSLPKTKRKKVERPLGEMGIDKPVDFWTAIDSISAQYLHYKRTSFAAIPRSSAKRNLELFLKEYKKTGYYLELNHRAETMLLDALLVSWPNEFVPISKSPTQAYIDQNVPRGVLIKACNLAIQTLTGQGNKTHDALDWYVRELARYYVTISGKRATHTVRDHSKTGGHSQTRDPRSEASCFVFMIARSADDAITNSNVNSVMERIVQRVPNT